MSLDYEIYPLKKLNEGASVFSGFAFKSNDFSDEGIPIVKIKNIQNKSVDLKEVQYFPLDKVNNKHKKFFLKNNDVLIAMTGQGSLGRVGRINLESNEYVLLNQRVGKFVVDEKNLHLNYLYHVISSDMYEKILFDRGTGSGQPNLSPEIILGTEIPMPNLTIQKKISSILDNINSKITLNKKINKNLLSIADAVFKKEFQNFEGYSEDDLITSDFGLIPKDWYYNTLDEISDVAIGKTPPRKETWWFSEKEGVKWVLIKDLGNSGTYVFETSEYLTEEAIEKFNVKLIPEDTIILSFKLTVGRLGITTEEMVTNEAIAHFKLDENSLISKEYLYLYLKNFNYEELGSTSSIAKAINSKIVKKIPVLIPTNNKMEEFKKLFENIFNEIKSNQLEINNLTKLRDTLLPKLMSGEIDVSKINCDLKIIIRKIYIKSSKLFLWRYLSENQNHIKNTKSNETLLKSRTIYKINKFLAKFNARYRYYRQQ